MDYLKLLKSTKARLLIIIFLTFLAYSNIFQNQFVVDDKFFINEWPDAKEFNLEKLVSGSLPSSVFGVYRPLRSILYAVYLKLGQGNSFIFHVHAILVHLSATILVYFITRQIVLSIKYYVLSKENILHTTYYILPFVTSLLFGLHPIHTESISYISAAVDTTGTVLILAAFYAYLKSRILKPLINRYLLISLVAFFLAVFTNELALILPLLIIWYELCFFKSDSKKIKIYLSYLLIIILYLFTRFFLINLTLSRGDYLAKSFYHTVIFMPQVFIKYIFLLFYPLNLSFIHNLAEGFESYMNPYTNFGSIINKHLYDWDILIPILASSMLIILTLKFIKKYSLIAFGIGWFFISLLPVSYIIPVGPALSERYLYLPSFGYVLLLAWGILWISEKAVNIIQKAKGKRQKFGSLVSLNKNVLVIKTTILLTFAFCILTFYGIRTYLRNYDWKDSQSLYKSVVNVYPKSLIGNYYLSLAYTDKKNYREAIYQYNELLKIKPGFFEARFNLANLYASQNKLQQAMAEYDKVITTSPDFLPAYTKLSNLFVLNGEKDKAVASLKRALDLKSDSYIILGNRQDNKNDLFQIKCILNNLNDEKYGIIPGLIFDYPQSLNIQKKPGFLLLTGNEDNKTIKITLEPKNSQKEDNLGLPLKQGRALVPQFDESFVTFFQNGKVQITEFLLIKNNQQAKIIVTNPNPIFEDLQNYPPLNRILSSVWICDN